MSKKAWLELENYLNHGKNDKEIIDTFSGTHSDHRTYDLALTTVDVNYFYFEN